MKTQMILLFRLHICQWVTKRYQTANSAVQSVIMEKIELIHMDPVAKATNVVYGCVDRHVYMQIMN